ncbi:hypothetical protein HMSP1_88 [Sinorhizobium phage HMSP1-Susan]|nr:hypothetical protein HMSP1_88 [Sinorhizobium phage HMSP1-Susan]
MNTDRFPRAKVLVNKGGTLSVHFMQNGVERVFFFEGGERHSLSSAVVNALANPGVEYIVTWDDEARK